MMHRRCHSDLFRTLAGFGGEMVDLHACGKGEPRGLSFPVKGENVIEEVRYQPPNTGVRPSPGAATPKDGKARDNSLASIAGRVAASGTDALHPDHVWINDREYVEGVPESAWTFPIGGYLPAQRWLKDRIGRTLDFVEQEEYMRIIWALMETKRMMGEIDASIKQHGGWPLK